MSSVYKDLGALYTLYSGNTQTFSATIIDPNTGTALALTDTVKYATISVNIVKPNGNVLGVVAGTYFDRTNGIIQYTIDKTIAKNVNAGNFIAEIILINSTSVPVLQQDANFNIIKTNYIR